MCDLMPAAAGLPGLADVGIDPFLARFRRETTFLVWTGIVLGAVLYAITPLLTVYLPLPSFLLPRAARERHADRICSTRFYLLRQTVFLLKMYACMAWGQNAGVRSRFHLPALPDDPGTFRQA
jgi:hypothetical protein